MQLLLSLISVTGCFGLGSFASLLSACSSTVLSDSVFDGNETDPIDTALTLVVVASAGCDRLDLAFPSVNCREGVLFALGLADCLIDETTSKAVLLADDILSRATFVTAVGLRGQVLVYQLDRFDDFSGEFVVESASVVTAEFAWEALVSGTELSAPPGFDPCCSCGAFEAIKVR